VWGIYFNIQKSKFREGFMNEILSIDDFDFLFESMGDGEPALVALGERAEADQVAASLGKLPEASAQLLKEFEILFPETSAAAERKYLSDTDYLGDLLRANSQRLLLKAISSRKYFRKLVARPLLDLVDSDEQIMKLAQERHSLYKRQIFIRMEVGEGLPKFASFVSTFRLDQHEASGLLTLFQLRWHNIRVTVKDFTDAISPNYAAQVRLAKIFGPNGKLAHDNLIWLGNRSDVLHSEIRISDYVFNVIASARLQLVKFEYKNSEMGKVYEPRVAWEKVILPEDQKQELLTIVGGHEDPEIRNKVLGIGENAKGLPIMLEGVAGTGKTSLVHALATKLGWPLLVADTGRLARSNNFRAEFQNVLAWARHENCLLLIPNCELVLRAGSRKISGFLSDLQSYNGATIFVTNSVETVDVAIRRQIVLTLQFGMPDTNFRELLWRQFAHSVPNNLTDAEWQKLAIELEKTGRQIEQAVIAAWYRKAQTADQFLRYQDLHVAALKQ
jgi:hypothetical protein